MVNSKDDRPEILIIGPDIDYGPAPARVVLPYRHNVTLSPEPRVYFISAADDRIEHCPIKIGSSRSPVSRAYEMSAHSPFPLVVLASAPGGVARERIYQERFSSLRLHGEWFARSPEILRLIKWLGSREPRS